jgi:hypothetical protein
MTYRTRRKWAADRLMEQTAPFDTVCRVCRKPIVRGEAIHAFTWSEELGRAHVACGFYALDADTYTDRTAIAVARKLLALSSGAKMPRALRDEAIAVSLVRRVHTAGNHEAHISATTIGAALLKTLKEQNAHAPKVAPSVAAAGAPLLSSRVDDVTSAAPSVVSEENRR